MFQTLGYFLELSVSIYFFFVVTLFLINVCEFMPLNSHENLVEEKVYIRSEISTAKAMTSEPSVAAQKTARKSKSTDKLKPDRSKSTDKSKPAKAEEKEEPTDKKDESPEQAEQPPQSTGNSQNPDATAQEEIDASPAVPNETEAQVEPAVAEPDEAAAPTEEAKPGEEGEVAAPAVTAEPGGTPEPGEAAAPAETTGPAEATEPPTAEANATEPEPEANG